jgi:hypothetical protein
VSSDLDVGAAKAAVKEVNKWLVGSKRSVGLGRCTSLFFPSMKVCHRHFVVVVLK